MDNRVLVWSPSTPLAIVMYFQLLFKIKKKQWVTFKVLGYWKYIWLDGSFFVVFLHYASLRLVPRCVFDNYASSICMATIEYLR